MRAALSVSIRASLSRGGRRRGLLLIGVGVLSALCLLGSFAAASIKQHEARRTAAQQPVFGAPGDPGLGYTEVEEHVRGSRVRIVRLASEGSASGERTPLPPGLRALPEPGQVLVSPALADLMDRSSAVRKWFPGGRGDTLPRAAVGGAGELLAYVGVSPEELLSNDPRPVIGFEDGAGAESGFGWYPTMGCAAFLVLPGMALILTGGRFGRQIRSRRHAALRLIGMPRAGRLSAACDVALPVAVGALGAAVLWPFIQPYRLQLPITGRWLFGADARVSLPGSAAAVLFVTLLAAGLALASTRQRKRTVAPLRLASRARTSGPLVGSLFVLGLALLAVAWTRHQARDPFLWVAIVLLDCDLPGAATWVGQRLTRLLGLGEPGLVRLFAVRRLAADAPTLFRVAAMVGVAVFVVGASQPVSQIIALPNSTWIQEARSDGQDTVLSRATTLEAGPLNPRPTPKSIGISVSAIGLWGTKQQAADAPAGAALIATCPQLADLIGSKLSSCPGGRMTVHIDRSDGMPDEAPPAKTIVVRSTDRTTQHQLNLPKATVSWPFSDTDTPVDAFLVLPPDDPILQSLGHSGPFISAAYVRTKPTLEAWDEAQAWTVASSPRTAWRTPMKVPRSPTAPAPGSSSASPPLRPSPRSERSSPWWTTTPADVSGSPCAPSGSAGAASSPYNSRKRSTPRRSPSGSLHWPAPS